MCIPLTSNLKWAEAPGNVLLPARCTGLRKDSVALVAQVVTLDKATLAERTGSLGSSELGRLLDGLDLVLDR